MFAIRPQGLLTASAARPASVMRNCSGADGPILRSIQPFRIKPAIVISPAGYVYRGDVANNAIKLAGVELGMFNERKELKLVADFDKYGRDVTLDLGGG